MSLFKDKLSSSKLRPHVTIFYHDADNLKLMNKVFEVFNTKDKAVIHQSIMMNEDVLSYNYDKF